MNYYAIDTHTAIKKLEAVGFQTEQAEVVTSLFSSRESELATKEDLKTAISGLRVELKAAQVVIILSAACVLAAFASTPVWAWWDIGHKVVCQVAWQEIAPSTRAAIEDLLGGPEPGLANACVWADEVKNEPKYSNTKPHHYINLPHDSEAIDLDIDCPPEPGCVVRAADRHFATLSDSESPKQSRTEALKFLTHFVGDMHQPLHAGYATDRGGNNIEVTFFGNKTNLHKVWDGEMLKHHLERNKQSWKELARTLHLEITQEERREWRAGKPADWAFESFRMAKHCAYKKPSNGWRRLKQKYLDHHLLPVMRQLKKAGIRLAERLNAAFSADWETRHPAPTAPGHSEYYPCTDGLSGKALREALHGLIKDHTKLSYKQVWDELKKTDADPLNPDSVILFYSRRSEGMDRRDTENNDNDAWNREHVWPKSHGFPVERKGPYTDLHHLRPADKTVNSSRNDKDFDNSDNSHKEATGAKSDSDSFEPPDAVKGDTARMIFYMAVRYEGGNCEPDLTILKTLSRSDTPTFGRLCTLLSWHQRDPVDPSEAQRNDLVQDIQGNRNPFIDRPEWVQAIWAKNCPKLK